MDEFKLLIEQISKMDIIQYLKYVKERKKEQEKEEDDEKDEKTEDSTIDESINRILRLKNIIKNKNIEYKFKF